MFKPLTLCLGLAVALVASSAALAGGHGSKSLPSAQGPYPAEQVVPSAQGVPCGPVEKKHCFKNPFHGICLPKIKMNHNYTYTWVLKKKHCGPLFTIEKGQKHKGCDSCGDAPGVYPTAQYAAAPAYSSPQAYGSGQAGTYGSGQAGAYGSGQLYGTSAPAGEMAPPVPATEGMEAPPAPPVGDPVPPVGGTSMLFPPTGN